MNATHKHDKQELNYPVDHLLQHADEHAWSTKAAQEAWFSNPAQLRGNQQYAPSEPKHQQAQPLNHLELLDSKAAQAAIGDHPALPKLTLDAAAEKQSQKQELHEDWLERWKGIINRAPEENKEMIFIQLSGSHKITRDELRMLFADTDLAFS